MMGWNEAIDQAVEVMAEAFYERDHESVSEPNVWISECDEGVRNWYRSMAAAALTALLEATQSETCATCGGLGQILVADPTVIDPFCPDCTNGRVPGAPLVLLAPRQVAWLGPYGVIPGGMDNDPAPNWEPLYAAQTEEKQT